MKTAGILIALTVAGVCGCGGDVQVELAAADTLQVVADQLDQAANEYHRDIEQLDTQREQAVTAAFVARVRSDHEDEALLDKHTESFMAAMQKVRQDRQVEWQRNRSLQDNVAILRDMASQMQSLAINSMTVRDELRRYLTGWIETRRRAQASPMTQTQTGGS